MLTTVNNILPILGLILCIVVMLIRSINTRGAICAAKLNLYAVGWLMLLWADFGSDFVPVFATVLFRLTMLVNNLLYVKLITIPYPVKFKRLWPPRFKL